MKFILHNPRLTAHVTWNRGPLGHNEMDGKFLPLIERETDLGQEILVEGTCLHPKHKN